MALGTTIITPSSQMGIVLMLRPPGRSRASCPPGRAGRPGSGGRRAGGGAGWGVDATPVGAQAQDQLEDQVEGVLAYSQPLAGVGAQADAGEDGLYRVAGAEVH